MELKVIGRLSKSTAQDPSFTKTTSLENLMLSLSKMLPVDIVYTVFQDPSGAMVLQPIGTLSVQFTPLEPLNDPAPTLPPEAPKQSQPEPITAPLEQEPDETPTLADLLTAESESEPDLPKVTLSSPEGGRTGILGRH